MAAQYATQQPSGYKNHIANVAIVGAGGQQGKYLAAELVAKKIFTVTALARPDSENKPVAGVKVVAVNYEEHASLVNALTGQDALLITLSVSAPKDQQQKLIRAAAEANVPWVFTNEWGIDQMPGLAEDTLMTSKNDDRQLLEQLGKSSWVGVCCGFWYEYSLSSPGLYGFKINEREVCFYDDGKTVINTSTWVQTAKTVAGVLALKILPDDENDKSPTLSDYRNNWLYCSSFTISQQDMFDSLKRVTNTTGEDWKISSVPSKQCFLDSREKLFKEGDRMAFGFMLYSRLFFQDDSGLFEKRHALDNEKLGLPKEDLDEATTEAVRMAGQDYFAAMRMKMNAQAH